MQKIFSKIYFFLRFITPVIFIAGIIFYLSAQLGLGDIKNNYLETILRKGAHFTEYGLLTFFVWRLLYNGWKFMLVVSFWLTLVLVTLYAGSDEFHQTFVVGRSGKMIDVVIDFLSIFTILQIILFFIKKKIKYIILALGSLTLFASIMGTMIWKYHQETSHLKSVHSVKISTGGINNDGKQEEGLSNSSKESKIKFSQNNYINSDNLDIVPGEKEDVIKNSKKNKNKNIILPNKVIYDVPFTTQSPFAKWDELHEEACEEASLIMLKYYNDKIERPSLSKNSLSKKVAEEEIEKLVKYQIKKYGDFYDTDVKTTKQIGEDFYKLDNLKIIENFTIEDLKKELAQGDIILVPTAGRELGNQNFTPPGPLYHNLVIIGYDNKAMIDSAGRKSKGIFITNDPGTRNGQNYKYNQQVLYKAVHDFPGNINKISEGPKRAIILKQSPVPY